MYTQMSCLYSVEDKGDWKHFRCFDEYNLRLRRSLKVAINYLLTYYRGLPCFHHYASATILRLIDSLDGT